MSTATRDFKRQRSAPTESKNVLRLPHELLVKILYYATRPESGRETDGHREVYLSHDLTPWETLRAIITHSKHRIHNSLAALLVCRRFYYAGIEAYYGSSRIWLGSLDSLRRLTCTLGPDRLRCIRNVVLKMWWRYVNTGMPNTTNEVPVLNLQHGSVSELVDDPFAPYPKLLTVRVELFGPPRSSWPRDKAKSVMDKQIAMDNYNWSCGDMVSVGYPLFDLEDLMKELGKNGDLWLHWLDHRGAVEIRCLFK